MECGTTLRVVESRLGEPRHNEIRPSTNSFASAKGACVDTLFPFGFPFPTAFYLTAYLASLMLHVVFMNYVLAGSAHLLGRAVLRGSQPDHSQVSEVLRDWLPFMLSAAITAGIAPLLFLQILYRRQFYTANLLLFY